MQKLNFLKPALPLTVISVIIALLLAVVNSVTADRIVQNTLIEKENAIKGIFAQCDTFESADETAFENTVSDAGTVLDAWGKVIGYYADVAPVGFKGEISLIVGTDTSGVVVGAALLSASETPGVGTKATDASYLSKFTGLSSEDISGVDTITGATISSRAVRRGIESAVATINNIKEGK